MAFERWTRGRQPPRRRSRSAGNVRGQVLLGPARRFLLFTRRKRKSLGARLERHRAAKEVLSGTVRDLGRRLFGQTARALSPISVEHAGVGPFECRHGSETR